MTRTTTTAATAVLLATVVSSATAFAAPDGPEPHITARPAGAPAATAIRLTGMLDVFNGGAYAVEVSRRAGPVFGMDAAFGGNSMDYGHSGIFAELLARAYLFTGPAGVSLALGPSLRSANEFGTVGFVRAELAVELRSLGVPNLLLGLGPELALNDSGQGTCPHSGLFSCLLWRDTWRAGDVGFRVRVAAGWAF
jgi:hypothetical protein